MFWDDLTALTFPDASTTRRSTRMLMNCRPPALLVCSPPKKPQLDSLGLCTGVELFSSLDRGPTKYVHRYSRIEADGAELLPSKTQSKKAFTSGQASSVPVGRMVTGAWSLLSFRSAGDSDLTVKFALSAGGGTGVTESATA